MADGNELKQIAKARLKTAAILIKNQDWDMAAYLMGHTLECALKSTICKTLHLVSYPSPSSKQDNHFITHNLLVLMRLAGLEDLFTAGGTGFTPWSEFTKEFPGEWVAMRYNPGRFDEPTTKLLFKHLNDKTPGSEGILTILTKRKRW